MSNSIKKLIPSFFTFCNLLCGVVAILLTVFYVSRTSLVIGCILLIGGALFDGIDGRLARKFDVVSDIGKQLDGFADLVTFVLAPIIIWLVFVVHLQERAVNWIEIALTCGYVASGVYRLARYNCCVFKEHFEGLPTLIASILICVLIFASDFFYGYLSSNLVYIILSYVFIGLLSIAMVSRFKIKRI